MDSIYDVFVRTWWRRNRTWPNGLEPHPGVKRYLARQVSYDEARALCRTYNASHDPGPLSRKAEFEEVR